MIFYGLETLSISLSVPGLSGSPNFKVFRLKIESDFVKVDNIQITGKALVS